MWALANSIIEMEPSGHLVNFRNERLKFSYNLCSTIIEVQIFMYCYSTTYVYVHKNLKRMHAHVVRLSLSNKTGYSKAIAY